VEEGWIETCEGRVIDNGLIKARIKYCLEMFDVQEVCFDRYNSREMSTNLIEDGVPCIEIPQTCPGLNEATKKLIALIRMVPIGLSVGSCGCRLLRQRINIDGTRPPLALWQAALTS
jgi:hypothetical protein